MKFCEVLLLVFMNSPPRKVYTIIEIILLLINLIWCFVVISLTSRNLSEYQFFEVKKYYPKFNKSIALLCKRDFNFDFGHEIPHVYLNWTVDNVLHNLSKSGFEGYTIFSIIVIGRIFFYVFEVYAKQLEQDIKISEEHPNSNQPT